MKHQPGTKYEYSVSIDVAGYLIEVLSGMSFDEFLQTRMFGPLGMDDSGFEVPEEDVRDDKKAADYLCDGCGSLIEEYRAPATAQSTTAPDCGVQSAAVDQLTTVQEIHCTTCERNRA